MDYIIHLDLPNAFYRLKAFIYYTALYLSSYLSPTQKENLNLLHKSTLPSQQNSTRTVSADQNATEILGILEEIFEKKISLTGLNVPVAATGKKVASSSGTKKKSKKNTKSDNPPVDITPQSEGTSIDSSSNVVSSLILPQFSLFSG